MRQGSNSGRRPRGRTNRKQHGGGGGQSRTHTFDSNGPDGRVRGNARQVYEKYLALARDASSAGDRIAAEAYYQYAEHYFRILNDSTDPQTQRRHEERQPQANGHAEAYGADDDQPVIPNGRAFQGDDPAPSQGNGAAVQAEAQPEAGVAAGTGEAVNGEEVEAAPRPRRGRPRKPRANDDSKTAKTEAAAEAEDGPAAS